MKERRNRGFVSLILIVIIGLALLKYFFDFSIFDALNSEQGRATLTYLKELLVYLKGFILDIWGYIR